MQYLQLVKVIEIAGGGGIQVVELESGSPYRNLAMFLHGDAVAVSAQPLFGGQIDGAATAVAGPVAKKIYQAADYEVRPATQGLPPGVVPLKSALRLTNTDGATAKLSVFIVALT